MGLFGGLIAACVVQQSLATEFVVTGKNGESVEIITTQVVSPDGSFVNSGGGGTVDLSGSPATRERIAVVNGIGGRFGATTVRGAPARVVFDEQTMISTDDAARTSFARDQASAAQAAIDACDRAGYDAALARLENFRLMNQADLWHADAALGTASQTLGIPPQRTVKDFDKLVRDAERAAAGGFGDPARVKQLKDGTAAYLPLVQRYAEAAYNVREAERLRAGIKPFPEPCGEKRIGFLGSDGKQSFGIAVGIGRSQYDFPNYRAYSLEDMGIFIKTDIVDEDRDVSVFDAFGTGFFYIPGTETALRIGGRITDMSSRSKLDLMVAPAIGQRFAFPTPDGGFFTTNPVDRFRVEQEFRQYQFNAQVERGFSLGAAMVRPYAGVNLSFIDAQDSSRFKIPVSSVRFEEMRSLDTFGFGPVLGVEVEVPIEGGMYGFGGIGGELRWNSSQAKWKTQVDIMGVTTDTQSTKESDDQMTWGATASLGVGYRGKGFDLRVYGTAGMSNHYPYLDVESDVGDGDPSIEWNDTSFWGIRLELGARF